MIGKGRNFTHYSIRKGRKIYQLGLWKGLKGLTDSFFVTDSYLKDRAFTAVKRDTKFLRERILSWFYTKCVRGLPFFVKKMVYKRVRG